MMTDDERRRALLVNAVGNKAKHDHHCGQQPNHHSGVLPRVSDIVVGTATVLALLSVGEEGHYDYYANADQSEHSASSEAGFSPSLFLPRYCCSRHYSVRVRFD
jgi:hypothetical protein